MLISTMPRTPDSHFFTELMLKRVSLRDVCIFLPCPTGDIFETFCFADEWTFVPDHFAYSVEHIPSKDEALKYMLDTWQMSEIVIQGSGIFKDLEGIFMILHVLAFLARQRAPEEK